MIGGMTALKIIKPYLVKGGVALGIALAVGAGYLLWSNSIYDKGYNAAMAEVKVKNREEAIKIAKYVEWKEKEVEAEYKEREERILNATKIYAQHWAELSLNPIVINSVRVRTVPTKCSGDPVSGGAKTGSGEAEANSGTYEAQLSERAARSVNEVMNAIDQLRLECEQVVNMMP